MHTHGRGKQDVGRPSLRLLGKMLADLAKELLVPRCRQRDTAREQRGLGMGQHLVGRPTAASAEAHLRAPDEHAAASSIRPVGCLDRRDILCRDLLGPPEVCGRQERHLVDVSRVCADPKGCKSQRTFSSSVKVASFFLASDLVSFGGPLRCTGLSGGESSVSGVVSVSTLPTGDTFRSISWPMLTPVAESSAAIGPSRASSVVDGKRGQKVGALVAKIQTRAWCGRSLLRQKRQQPGCCELCYS